VAAGGGGAACSWCRAHPVSARARPAPRQRRGRRPAPPPPQRLRPEPPRRTAPGRGEAGRAEHRPRGRAPFRR
ncbi:unnamed protein product, partial [Acidocella sp. C78]